MGVNAKVRWGGRIYGMEGWDGGWDGVSGGTGGKGEMIACQSTL